MQRLILIFVSGLFLVPQASFALRVLEQLERSYELSLADVTVPRSTTSSVLFRTCDTCTTQSLAVTPSTKYFDDERELTHAELLSAVDSIRQQPGGNEGTLVGLFYDIKTNVVTRIIFIRNFTR